MGGAEVGGGGFGSASSVMWTVLKLGWYRREWEWDIGVAWGHGGDGGV